MLKTILLIEHDPILKEFFSRVFYIDGFEVLFLNSEEDIKTLTPAEADTVNLVVIDDCNNPESFKKDFNRIFLDLDIKRKIPMLGVLKKGVDPEPAHQQFDAVMVKDNFNIQLLADLVERLTS